MGKHDVVAKILALVGSVLVATPILAPLLVSISSIGSPGGYGVDYLMPFEIYPVALVGAGLVLWAALRAHVRRALVGACIGVMLGGVLLGAAAAKLTGIADSAEQLEAWRYAIVIALGAASLIGQAALVVAGSLVARDLFAHHGDAAPPMTPA